MNPDDSFVKQLKDGQPHAVEVLVAKYEASLYRLFLCDHRNHHLAQEQTAETFVQLVRALPTMRGGSDKLKSFVFGVARNVQRRGWRRRAASRRSIELSDEVLDPGRSPPVEASVREQIDLVLAAISRLEQPLQNVLLLRFVEDCSLAEIAEALEIPLGTVKSHIHRGRDRLKQLFEDQECRE